MRNQRFVALHRSRLLSKHDPSIDGALWTMPYMLVRFRQAGHDQSPIDAVRQTWVKCGISVGEARPASVATNAAARIYECFSVEQEQQWQDQQLLSDPLNKSLRVGALQGVNKPI